MDCDDADANTVGDDDCDGYYTCDPVPDCDDGDASAYPGATEILNDGIDQDCDGVDLTTLGSCLEYYEFDNTYSDGVYDVIDGGNAMRFTVYIQRWLDIGSQRTR